MLGEDGTPLVINELCSAIPKALWRDNININRPTLTSSQLLPKRCTFTQTKHTCLLTYLSPGTSVMPKIHTVKTQKNKQKEII
jgi:hypothetical protein